MAKDNALLVRTGYRICESREEGKGEGGLRSYGLCGTFGRTAGPVRTTRPYTLLDDVMPCASQRSA